MGIEVVKKYRAGAGFVSVVNEYGTLSLAIESYLLKHIGHSLKFEWEWDERIHDGRIEIKGDIIDVRIFDYRIIGEARADVEMSYLSDASEENLSIIRRVLNSSGLEEDIKNNGKNID